MHRPAAGRFPNLALAALLVQAAAGLAACDQARESAQVQTSETPSSEHVPLGAAPEAAAPAPEAAAAGSDPAASEPGSAASGQGAPVVELYTDKGLVAIELDPVRAPITTQNFLEYVRSGHYDGTIFHRVIPGFMIQGGGMTAGMDEKPTRAPIQNESQNGLKNARGTVAMARKPDPHSATAQFFVNLVDNAALDYPSHGGYTVFGRVVAGMDVVDAIAQVRTSNRGMHQNVPVEPVAIQKAKVR